MVKDIIIYVLIGAGLLSASIAVIGLFRFKIVYMRLLVSSYIDSLGMILMMTGAMIASDGLMMALKIALIIILALITSPLSTHAITMSAYDSGYRTR